jgi:cytochrome c biogenesis protein CcmG/thiol:disulfide interchange protein DsbE
MKYATSSSPAGKPVATGDVQLARGRVAAPWRFLPLLLPATLVVLLVGVLERGARQAPPPPTGLPAPSFVLPTLDDRGRSFAPDSMKGRVWVLNVWASWCAPCRDEHPVLVALAREHAVPIVGLNYKDDPRAAKEWLLRLGDPYMVTAVDRDGSSAMGWGVHGVPETFVIDGAGIVRHRMTGSLTRAAWISQVQPLLGPTTRATP